jgi:hypothetical protein
VLRLTPARFAGQGVIYRPAAGWRFMQRPRFSAASLRVEVAEIEVGSLAQAGEDSELALTSPEHEYEPYCLVTAADTVATWHTSRRNGQFM